MTDPTAPVSYDVVDGVATITLNRPDAMNSLNIATKEALRDIVVEAGGDESVRCVVLTGSGRAFCVGQDLKEHVQLLESGSSDQLFTTVEDHYNPTVTALATMPKPVIAAINGVAAGAGASLAFPGVALSCDTGASWTLPRLVGRAKAIELLYFPSTIGAAKALELGLATSVVPDDQLTAEVSTLAAKLASGPTLSYASMRQAVNFSSSHDFAESLAFEASKMNLTGASQDHRDAVAAFVAKEKPTFHGR